MAAKKKEVMTLSLADIGVEADEVGSGQRRFHGACRPRSPGRPAGEKIADDGEGGKKIAEYLVAQKII